MTTDDRKKLYQLLSAPFPEEAIERVKGAVSGRPYDSASVRTQFLINRLNEVLGVGGYRIHRNITVRQITTPKGRTMYEAVADMTIEIGEWVDGKFVVVGESVGTGGHLSASQLDAEKGAHTNAVKRTLAGFGLGKATWEGRLDEDALTGDAEFVPQPVMTVVRSPVAQAPVAQLQAPTTPPGYTRPPNVAEARPQQPDRNRLSSKQLAAIWSIARKLGIEQSSFRAQIKATHGVQLEFLPRNVASTVISALQGQLNGNGNGSGLHADEQQPEGVA